MTDASTQFGVWKLMTSPRQCLALPVKPSKGGAVGFAKIDDRVRVRFGPIACPVRQRAILPDARAGKSAQMLRQAGGKLDGHGAVSS